MAKRQRRSPSQLDRTATLIGTHLGHLARKYDLWIKQRDEIAAELRRYVESAETMISGMGHTADVAIGRAARRGRRVIPPEHRRKISEAAKARWAKRKAGKTRTISPAARARLSKLAKARWAKARKAGKTKLE
jgi:hypothetical protein